MSDYTNRISDWIDENRQQCIEFLQQVISIPSPSYEEKEEAMFLAAKMREFGFDIAKTDATSNAIGLIPGKGAGRSLLMNGHIDHVPVGDMVDPYSGQIMDGSRFGEAGQVIYGRAACDMKAAVAAMILAGKIIKDLKIPLKGDYKVTAVAQEEVGGAGTISTIVDSQILADLVVIGEATNMNVNLGHRGSIKMAVVVHGRACHASAPERGVNALYKAIKIITRIKDELVPSLPSHPIYGKVSLVVTQIEVTPKAFNVVPEKCVFQIDCRNHPDYRAEALYSDLKSIIAELKKTDPEFNATVLPTTLINERRFSGFYTDPEEHQIVRDAVSAVAEARGEPTLGMWTFATDGRIYSRLGIPVIGFGPGEEKYAHTQQDHVRLADYLDTIKVYAWLACGVCGVSES